MAPILKSNFKSKSIDIAKIKLPLCKHKNGNTYANKRKSEHANTKTRKTLKLSVNNVLSETRPCRCCTHPTYA